jgi:tRNA(Ile)-lysidine synthase
VVAHVNYNFREESKKETQLVREFCDKNNIEKYVLEVDQSILDKYSQYSNKQQMAREIRYDFYKEVANKVMSNEVYIAHHKDDFIETAIMQEEKSKDLPFYGIEKKTAIDNIVVKRPLLKMYKDEILEKAKK